LFHAIGLVEKVGKNSNRAIKWELLPFVAIFGTAMYEEKLGHKGAIITKRRLLAFDWYHT
jgi:hypothetical protein